MSSNYQWYALKVIGGQEDQIKKNIEDTLQKKSFEQYVKEIFVYSKKIYTVADGKKKIQDKKLLPGYLLINANLENAEVIHHLNFTSGVLGFLTDHSWSKVKKPYPLNSDEIKDMLGIEAKDFSSSLDKNVSEIFEIGEEVKIIDGPFKDFVVHIENVFPEKNKIKVIAKVFDRETLLELDWLQVEKIKG